MTTANPTPLNYRDAAHHLLAGLQPPPAMALDQGFAAATAYLQQQPQPKWQETLAWASQQLQQQPPVPQAAPQQAPQYQQPAPQIHNGEMLQIGYQPAPQQAPSPEALLAFARTQVPPDGPVPQLHGGALLWLGNNGQQDVVVDNGQTGHPPAGLTAPRNVGREVLNGSTMAAPPNGSPPPNGLSGPSEPPAAWTAPLAQPGYTPLPAAGQINPPDAQAANLAATTPEEGTGKAKGSRAKKGAAGIPSDVDMLAVLNRIAAALEFLVHKHGG